MVRKEDQQPFDIKYNARPNTPEERLSQGFIFPWAESLVRIDPSRNKILDLASGQGIESAQLAQRGFYVISQDLSAEMLAASYYDGPKVAATAEKLPYRDNEFNGILLKDALVFMSPSSRLEMLQETHRTLASNGSILIISETTWMRVWKQDHPDRLAYKDTYPTNKNWEAILTDARSAYDFSLTFATDPADFSEMARSIGFEPNLLSSYTFESPLYKDKRWGGGEGGFVVQLTKPA